MTAETTPTHRQAAFICDDVEVCFGRTVALDGLHLEARYGEITGLVGPNGAGKTTTLRLAAGLVHPRRGSVLVAGLDPVRRPTAARRLLGFLPDRPALPPHLSARELLCLRGALFGLDRPLIEERIDSLDRELGLSDLLDRWCRVLSHGQAQRIALASIMLPAPPLLLVDEPMTALDLEAQLAVREALRRRAADGVAAVVTTHTVDHIAALADHVVHLREGRAVAERTGTRDSRELESWLLSQSS